MLYWQHFNLTCLPEKVLKEVHEQMNLLVKQEIPSIIMYQRIALDLAAGPLNAGRVLVIQFFSETVKEHLVKKLCGISQSEYRNQSWFLWLITYFSRQAVTYRRLIREIEHIEGLCLLFAHLRLQCGSTGSEEKEKNVVTFNPEIVVHLIPYEDRSSEWMRYAIDRAHFQRRVQLFEELFTAL